MKRMILFGLLTLALHSCDQMKKVDTMDSTTDSSDLLDAGQDLYSDGKGQIIKTAEFRFQVKDMKKSKTNIVSTLKKYSAFIASSDLKLENPVLEEHLTIRVQSDYFEDLLKEIHDQAVFVNYERVNTEDVAKQFVDLESRLQTKRDVEKRYAEILRSKAGTIDELLKAEQQIGHLHEEIEATVSRINFLKDEVRYSTIKLEIYQVVEQQYAEIRTGPGILTKFGIAFKAGLDGLIEILIRLSYMWPLLLMCILGYFYWIKRLRKIKL